MIKKALEYNETVQPNSHEIELLKRYFPQYFDEDEHFMLDKFQNMLTQQDLETTKESYRLEFLGKSYAKYLTSLKTETVLVPDLQHNHSERNQESENLYIIGDNLDGLKHLRHSYEEMIKCIYIDPPYNTTEDGFIYEDNFQFTIDDLVKKVGLEEDEARRILELQGKSSHSAWMTFMLPRLELAKILLDDTGLIFISIDDNEQANLKLLCDSVFGEQNFVSNIIWRSRTSISDDLEVSMNHNHTLVYSKNRDALEFWGNDLDDAEYDNPDDDPRGPWKLVPLDANKPGGDTYYPVRNPLTGVDYYPPGTRSWAINRTAMQELMDDGRVKFGKNNDSAPKKKLFYYERMEKGDTKTPSSLLLDVGTTQNGSGEVMDLFDDTKVFDYPKPVALVKRLLAYGTRGAKDALILDFFSGSGTTAQAVMDLNAEDGGNRKFIMIQRPEPIDPDEGRTSQNAYQAGFRSVDEIGRERIVRAADKIQADSAAEIDYGFKLFRLEEPTVASLDKLDEFTPDEALFLEDHVKAFSSHDTPGNEVLLSTWLNHDGHGLIPSPVKSILDTYQLDVCGYYGYIIDPGFTNSDIVKLIELLENDELQIRYLVYFPYSLEFHVLQGLEVSLSSMKNNRRVILEPRY